MRDLLFLENDQLLSEEITKELKLHDWQVCAVQEGLEALVTGLTRNFTVAILDLDVIDLDGVQMIRHFHLHRPDTVLIATSRLATPEERAAAEQAGAQVYMRKPFTFDELQLTILNLLSRRQKVGTNRPRMEDWHDEQYSGEIKLADVTLNLRTCTVQRGGKEFELSPRELELLEFMMRHPNALISKNRLLAEVWNYDEGMKTRVVENYVSRLRKKLDTHFPAKRIHTERHRGYSFRTA